MSLETMTINAAMRYVYDQMERCNIPDYIILGDAARSIVDGTQIEKPFLEIGIREAEVTKEVLSNFLNWHYTFDPKTNSWNTSFEGIPIMFKVIKRKYSFFTHLDTKFYDVDEWHVPNPFEKYWKARFLIK